uniref:Uncharacterized protein n=1 Tax=Naja naja TaxID=35670 RepID=A0A8C6V4R5_NAJNA
QIILRDSNSFPPTPHSPPVKVLASQLKRCRQVPGGSWLLDREEYGCPALPVSLVWMQGKVLAVEQDGSTVRLLDESGSFVVSGVERVPKGKPCLSPGNYVMVMGLVQGWTSIKGVLCYRIHYRHLTSDITILADMQTTLLK